MEKRYQTRGVRVSIPEALVRSRKGKAAPAPPIKKKRKEERKRGVTVSAPCPGQKPHEVPDAGDDHKRGVPVSAPCPGQKPHKVPDAGDDHKRSVPVSSPCPGQKPHKVPDAGDKLKYEVCQDVIMTLLPYLQEIFEGGLMDTLNAVAISTGVKVMSQDQDRDGFQGSWTAVSKARTMLMEMVSEKQNPSPPEHHAAQEEATESVHDNQCETEALQQSRDAHLDQGETCETQNIPAHVDGDSTSDLSQTHTTKETDLSHDFTVQQLKSGSSLTCSIVTQATSDNVPEHARIETQQDQSTQYHSRSVSVPAHGNMSIGKQVSPRVMEGSVTADINTLPQPSNNASEGGTVVVQDKSVQIWDASISMDNTNVSKADSLACEDGAQTIDTVVMDATFVVRYGDITEGAPKGDPVMTQSNSPAALTESPATPVAMSCTLIADDLNAPTSNTPKDIYSSETNQGAARHRMSLRNSHTAKVCKLESQDDCDNSSAEPVQGIVPSAHTTFTVKICQDPAEESASPESAMTGEGGKGVYQCPYCPLVIKDTRSYKRHVEHHEAMPNIKVITKPQTDDFQDIILKENRLMADHFTRPLPGKRIWKCKHCHLLIRGNRAKCSLHFKMKHSELEIKPNLSVLNSNGGTAENLSGEGISERENSSNLVVADSKVGTPVVENLSGEGTSERENNSNLVVADSQVGTPVVEETELPPGKQSDGDFENDLSRISKLATRPKSTWMFNRPSKATTQCSKCDYRSTAFGIQRHMKRYHAKILYKCDLCPKTLAVLADLYIHHQNHFDKNGKLKPINWRKGYRYKDKTEPPKHICDVCSKGFYRNCDLKQHKKTHTLDVPAGDGMEVEDIVNCFMCPFIGQTHLELQKHVNSEHGKQRQCPHCQKMYADPPSLREHIKAFHTNQPFVQCEECGRSFTRQRYLNAHMLRHRKTKRHFCPVCGKGFLEKNKMVSHSAVHLADECRTKDHVCEVCGKRFSRRSYMRQHMTIHQMTKSFVCDICGAKFSFPSAFRKHVQLHSDQRPYKCQHPGCEKEFVQNCYLTQHMLVHGKEGRIPCERCGRTYLNELSFNRHKCLVLVAESNQQLGEGQGQTNESVETIKSGDGDDLRDYDIVSIVQVTESDSPMSENVVPESQASVVEEPASDAGLTPDTENPTLEAGEMFMCSECNHMSADLDAIQLHVAQHCNTQEQPVLVDSAIVTECTEEGEGVLVLEQLTESSLQGITVSEDGLHNVSYQ